MTWTLVQTVMVLGTFFSFPRDCFVSVRLSPSPHPIPIHQARDALSAAHPLTRVRSSPNPSGLSSSTSNIGSSSKSNALQGPLSPKPDDASPSRVRNRNESGSGKDHDMLRQTGVHTSKGLGRFAKALVQSPMELSMRFTKGFHNLPKLWGDDTVRPQAQVSDFMVRRQGSRKRVWPRLVRWRYWPGHSALERRPERGC